MKACFPDVDALTFDFYNTLVHHRTGRGRGETLMEYLRGCGLETDPWEHQVLYDVFERHGIEYSPEQPAQEKERYVRQFAELVFRRLNVRAPNGTAARHAANLWACLVRLASPSFQKSTMFCVWSRRPDIHWP
jgi:hypothetical protein